MVNEKRMIVFFDGVCNLCSHFVQFILKHEAHSNIHFSSLQSEFAQDFFKNYNLSNKHQVHLIVNGEYQSVYFYQNGVLMSKSSAALEICGELKSPFRLLKHLKIVPRFIRDTVYRVIAKYRYKFLGQKSECWVPQPQWSKRFLN